MKQRALCMALALMLLALAACGGEPAVSDTPTPATPAPTETVAPTAAPTETPTPTPEPTEAPEATPSAAPNISIDVSGDISANNEFAGFVLAHMQRLLEEYTAASEGRFEIEAAELNALTTLELSELAEGLRLCEAEYRFKIDKPESFDLPGLWLDDGCITERTAQGSPLFLMRSDNGKDTPVAVLYSDTLSLYSLPEYAEEYGDAYTAAAVCLDKLSREKYGGGQLPEDSENKLALAVSPASEALLNRYPERQELGFDDNDYNVSLLLTSSEKLTDVSLRYAALGAYDADSGELKLDELSPEKPLLLKCYLPSYAWAVRIGYTNAAGERVCCELTESGRDGSYNLNRLSFKRGSGELLAISAAQAFVLDPANAELLGLGGVLNYSHPEVFRFAGVALPNQDKVVMIKEEYNDAELQAITFHTTRENLARYLRIYVDADGEVFATAQLG